MARAVSARPQRGTDSSAGASNKAQRKQRLQRGLLLELQKRQQAQNVQAARIGRALSLDRIPKGNVRATVVALEKAAV